MNKLSYWRTQRDLTMRGLAALSGVSLSTISDLENGKRKGSLLILTRLAKALEVPVEEFSDLLESGPDNVT